MPANGPHLIVSTGPGLSLMREPRQEPGALRRWTKLQEKSGNVGRNMD